MNALMEMTVLTIDCQTTGATPARGRVLEIGWLVGKADNSYSNTLSAHLIRMPSEQNIPNAVRRVTGISKDDMANACNEADVWLALCQAAAQVAARNGLDRCPTVIHYARFEKPFLEALHQAHTPDAVFPFEIICTHAIAARLLPELPRRGIRALAGFFGHSLPQQRRSADHAQATLLIWQKLITLLQSRYRIQTVRELEKWLTITKVESKSKRSYPMVPIQHRSLPDSPGVYRMLRINNDILYIGKAKSLKKRVNSYFRPNAPHAEHILEMLSQARSIETTPTESALEAAMLEVEEIQRWSPPYNIALRDHQKQTLFFNRDLTSFSPSADDNYCLGPLPENQTGNTLAAFGKWMAADLSVEEEGLTAVAEMLKGAPGHLPDAQCLSAGLELFRKNYWNALSTSLPFHRLSLLGTKFWMEHQREKAERAETAIENDEEDNPVISPNAGPETVYLWTPETVEKIIKSQVRRWAHLLRRARWFCTLSESSLLWTEEACKIKQNHLLITAGGKVLRQNRLSPEAPLPVPPGHARSLSKRRIDLDMAAYDRLRVLTTEIRRFVSENRRICICLGPHAVLTNRSLSRLLQWL